MLLLLQFGTQHLDCAISGYYHGVLYLQTIPRSLVVVNRTQIPTCLEYDHYIEVLATVPKIDVNVIKWNPETDGQLKKFGSA